MSSLADIDSLPGEDDDWLEDWGDDEIYPDNCVPCEEDDWND